MGTFRVKGRLKTFREVSPTVSSRFGGWTILIELRFSCYKFYAMRGSIACVVKLYHYL